MVQVPAAVQLLSSLTHISPTLSRQQVLYYIPGLLACTRQTESDRICERLQTSLFQSLTTTSIFCGTACAKCFDLFAKFKSSVSQTLRAANQSCSACLRGSSCMNKESLASELMGQLASLVCQSNAKAARNQRKEPMTDSGYVHTRRPISSRDHLRGFHLLLLSPKMISENLRMFSQKSESHRFSGSYHGDQEGMIMHYVLKTKSRCKLHSHATQCVVLHARSLSELKSTARFYQPTSPPMTTSPPRTAPSAMPWLME